MLKKLKISNYALIDNIEISFENGMTSITGETGAGKSILLGGLSLVLGSRVDNTKIINKDKKCFVEATFDLEGKDLEIFFLDNDLDYDNQTIIRREVNQNGKSRAFINDTPVRLDQLTSLTNSLLDIHSQFNNLKILDTNFIFLILDSLSSNTVNANTYKKDFKSLVELEKKIQEKEIQRNTLESDLDYNNYLLNEFNSTDLDSIDLDYIENKVKEADSVDDIKEALSLINEEFNSEHIGISERLLNIVRKLNKVTGSSNRVKSLADNLSSIIQRLNDIIDDSQLILNDLSSSEEDINKLRENLNKIYTLQNKHRVSSIDELINIKENLLLVIDGHQNIDQEIKDLKSLKDDLIKDLTSRANSIHEKRYSVKNDFEKLLNQNLSELGMNNSEIKIDLSKTESIQKNGFSEGKFLLKSNKGDKYSDLRNIASGGEVSRIMLSIKSILSSYIKLSTIIFDEIDTGISGSVSSKVADLMDKMSKNMQVIVITHTPQVASKGDYHYKVFKKEVENKIITDIKLLEDKERVKEIAEMLSGDKSNKSANELANELLN
ncbi:MAG: AAA family ATPase [Flavobacteriaceae bacterium]|nr:AAA family ATPase [Cryomorphaceae bacterium]MBL6677332.1 AAA family ATPase [Flavobacteriaceae bacterium]